MTLALIPTAPTAGRQRIAEAQRLLQAALEALHQDAAERAQEAARRAQAAVRDAQVRVALRKHEAARREHEVVVDRRDWSGYIRDLKAVAAAALRRRVSRFRLTVL